MKKINLRNYYPFYSCDDIIEVSDELDMLFREYMLLEEAYRIRKYRYKAFYSLEGNEGIEREALKLPLPPDEILEQRQMTELIFKGLLLYRFVIIIHVVNLLVQGTAYQNFVRQDLVV